MWFFIVQFVKIVVSKNKAMASRRKVNEEDLFFDIFGE
jgi:hypothetical protein